MRSWIIKIRKTKIDYLDIAGMRNENVLDLEITMDDVISMTVLQSGANLPGELASDSLTKAAMGYDVVEHLAAIDVLEDHVIMVLVDNKFPHATDVRVM